MPRYIVLRIATGEMCDTADHYQDAVQARWNELFAQLSKSDAPFYRDVREVCNVECEATYEADGIRFELLLELEGARADVSKTDLGRVVRGLFCDGKVLLKRTVPPTPSNLLDTPQEP